MIKLCMTFFKHILKYIFIKITNIFVYFYILRVNFYSTKISYMYDDMVGI